MNQCREIMSHAAIVTKTLNNRRSRQKAYKRHRAENQRSFSNVESIEKDKSLITDFSQVRKAIKKRKRRELVVTIVSIVVSIIIVYLLATQIDWHWLMNNFKN